jgi:hypothetical protein
VLQFEPFSQEGRQGFRSPTGNRRRREVPPHPTVKLPCVAEALYASRRYRGGPDPEGPRRVIRKKRNRGLGGATTAATLAITNRMNGNNQKLWKPDLE